MELKEKAEKLYKSVNTFMISCVDKEGYPMTKAVVPGKYRDTINEMYFATNTASRFAQAIMVNNKASVYFYTKKLVWAGCYLKGEMEIVSDMKVKQKFWDSKFAGAYKERSFTDPDFCLLKFVPRAGRYYSWYNPEDLEF